MLDIWTRPSKVRIPLRRFRRGRGSAAAFCAPHIPLTGLDAFGGQCVGASKWMKMFGEPRATPG
eukprot:362226-Chlamydomonas_euryale.AAC.4